jgi:hypothetical protein
VQRYCSVLGKGHVGKAMWGVVGIGWVDARRRCSQNKASLEWGRANRVDVKGQEETAMATPRTIGSRSKDTSTICTTRISGFHQRRAAAPERFQKTSQTISVRTSRKILSPYYVLQLQDTLGEREITGPSTTKTSFVRVVSTNVQTCQTSHNAMSFNDASVPRPLWGSRTGLEGFSSPVFTPR